MMIVRQLKSVLYYLNMESDSIVNQRQGTRAICSLLEKLAAMNATKTKLRQYNVANIIIVDKLHSSPGLHILKL